MSNNNIRSASTSVSRRTLLKHGLAGAFVISSPWMTTSARAFIASAESGTVKVVSVTDPTDMSGARGRRRGLQIRTQAHTRPCAEHTRTREPQSLNLDTTPSMSRVSQRLAR